MQKINLWKKLLLLTVVIILFLLFFEIFLRIFSVDDAGFERVKLKREYLLIVRQSEEIGSVYKPNHSILVDYTAREKEVIILNFTTFPIPGYEIWGMRDDGFDHNKEKVFVVLGDSYTWGATVNATDIWSEIIEYRHNEVDMLNLALGGGISKAFEEYKILEPNLPDHQTVIYAAGMINEFLDNYAFMEAYKSGFVVTQNNLHKTRWFYPIISNSKVAYLGYKGYALTNFPVKNFFRKFFNNFRPQNDYLPEVDGYVDDEFGALGISLPNNQIGMNYALIGNHDPSFIKGVDETKRVLKDFNAFVKSKNRTFVVVVVPFKEQVYFNFIEDKILFNVNIKQPTNYILDVCEEHNIICIDPTDWMIENNHKKLYWFYDVHLTPVGQKVLADYVEKELKAKDLINS